MHIRLSHKSCLGHEYCQSVKRPLDGSLVTRCFSKTREFTRKGDSVKVSRLEMDANWIYWTQIQGRTVDMLREALKGKEVAECIDGRSKCGRCANGGLCVLSSRDDGGGPQFRCQCPEGFTGDLCQSRVCPGVNPCRAAGAVCLVGQDNRLICLCPYGKTGPRCESGKQFYWPNRRPSFAYDPVPTTVLIEIPSRKICIYCNEIDTDP